MKIVIVLDSFKGSLSSLEAGELLKESLSELEADIEVISVADGGEGSLEMIKENKLKVTEKAFDPLGRKIDSYFLTDGTTAYLEMATTCGLTLLSKNERNPLKTSTVGLGEQMLLAIEKGFKQIIIFVGGSGTNDAGLGALSVLGFKFYNKNNQEISPIAGGDLINVKHFQYPKDLCFPEILVATDVTNPLYGSNGATYVYGSQKGASGKDLEILEEGIINISKLFPDVDINQVKGSGAAGGLAGGFHLFLKAVISPATDILFEQINLKQKIKSADLVITGEGKLDTQSLNGKLVSKILDLSNDTKFIILAGQAEEDLTLKNILKVFTLKTTKMSTEYAMENAKELISQKGKEIAKFIRKNYL